MLFSPDDPVHEHLKDARLETGVNTCNPLEETGSITLCEVLALFSQCGEVL